MKLYSIASGSKGNATLIQHENLTLLIDAGISFKKLNDALSFINIDVDAITHVLLTHEHVDHIKGLETLYKRINVPIYTSFGTAKAMKFIESDTFGQKLNVIESMVAFQIGTLNILPIPLSHDASEPVGFILENKTHKIGYVTDTGYIKEGLIEPLRNCDLYYFEANHDPIMLKNSNRPYPTIYRILTERGHLSNEDSAYYLSQMVGENTKHVIMAHISEDCNTTEKIIEAYQKVFEANHLNINNYKIHFSSQKPLKVIEL